MTVKVQLVGDGLNYESEANLVQAAKIIGFLNTNEVLSDATVRPAVNAGFIDSPQVAQLSSPREAILSADAKTNTQKILVLGAYIVQRDNTDEFAATELKTLFIKAGESAPRNLSRDIREAVKAGYITESLNSSDSFIVTNTGYKTLEDGFFTEGSKGQTRTRKKISGKRNIKTPESPEWLTGVTVEDQMDGFLSYRQVKTRSNKVLWIAQWAAQHDHERINGSDISAIANQLADNIPRNQIAAAFSSHLTKGYASKTSDGYRILYDGTEYLKKLLDGERS